MNTISFLQAYDVGAQVSLCNRIKRAGQNEWFDLVQGTVAVDKQVYQFVSTD